MIPRWTRTLLLGSALALLSVVSWRTATAAPASSKTALAPVPAPVPAPAADADDAEAKEDAPEISVPSRLHAPPIASATPLTPAEDLLARARRDPLGRYVVPGKKGDRPLTIDPNLQEKLTDLLARYDTPYGAVVVIEPSTGRVLAMAEHAADAPKMRGLTTKALFPAASVFKMVTASALLEEGVSADEEECFHGGERHIREKLLEDSARDRRCLTLTQALAQSANAVFAKLTHKHLTPDALLGAAERFHFNRAVDFPIPTDMSLAAVPDDTLGLAKAGAGFGDVFISPLQGAMMASVIANEGLWRAPLLFEDQVRKAPAPERVMPTQVAEDLGAMMAQTVSAGTGRKIFHQRGYAIPDAAGKTGSLNDKHPYRDYTWFVGYAPRENPQVAVAAVVVNGYKWRIHGPYVAREAIRLALQRAKPVALSR
jgi:cell division protein FtsI/penicillin-binding protein 2